MRRAISTLILLILLAVAFAPAAFAAEEKPRIAVMEFENKADNQYWWRGGAAAIQDVFVTELVKSGKFRVIDRERLSTLLNEQNLSSSGRIDPSSLVRVGKLIGVDYFLVGAVTEYGEESKGGGGFGISIKKNKFTGAANARLIDAETGEIVWADEGRGEESNSKVRVRGVGGGVDDERMFDKVMKPIVEKLAASLKAADI